MAISDLELLRQARRLGYTLENEDEILQKEAQRLGFNLVGEGAAAPAPIFATPTPPPAPPTTIGGELMEVLKGLPRGAAGLLETAAAGAAALLPDQAERELRGEITEFFRPAREGLAPAAGYEESIGARAGEALGSTLPFLAAGPLGLAGRVAATGLGVAAGAGEARLRAEQEGGMEDRGAATALGALVGVTDVIPVFRILDRLPEKETLKIFDYIKRAAAAGGEEFAQEAGQNVAQNLIEKGLYNPEQDVLEGAAEEGAYGFGVGAFVQGLLDVALGRRARGAVAAPGGEDELSRIGAEPSVEGAGAGGAELPVSRIGAAGSDLEGLAPAGVGVPSEPAGRVDEGEEVLQPALRFQRGEEEPSNVVSMQERRAAQIDAEEEAEDLADYNEGIVSSRERLLETYTPTINTIRAFIDYGQNVLENTEYPNSLEAAELERQLPYLQEIVDKFEPIQTGTGIDQDYLSNWYGNTAWLEGNLKNVTGEKGWLNILQKFAEEIAPRPKLKKGQKKVSKVVPFRLPETVQSETAEPKFQLPYNPQVETPQFKNFFKDSKVTDDEGMPLVVYHGMPSEFEGNTLYASKTGTLGEGIYFTDNPEIASRFATGVRGDLSKEPKTQGNVVPAYVRIEKPFDDNFFVGNKDWQDWTLKLVENELKSTRYVNSWVKNYAEELSENLKNNSATLADVLFYGNSAGETQWKDKFLDAIKDTKYFDGIILKNSPKGFNEYLAFEDNQAKSAVGNIGKFAPESASLIAQRGAVPTTPKVPLERVQAAVQEATKGWTNAPKIIVAQNANDPVIPEPLRRQIPANARGFYDQGSVYVLADRAPSESAVRGTVFHESLGHYGLEQLFRSKLDQTLDSIYKTNTAIKAEVSKWIKQHPDAYAGPNQAIRAVEEILAGRAEKGVIKEPGIRAAFNRLAAMIRKFLRAMGFVKEYSNNDINNILLEAAERVRTQPGPVFNTDASPKFQISQYNRVLTNALEANQRLPEWSQSVGDGVANAMSKMPENLRNAQYYIYSMPQVIELLEKYTPRIKAIDRFIGYRASYTTGLMKTASENHAKYTAVAREYPDKYEEFKNVVNDINLFQVPVREQSVIDLLSQNRASLSPQKQKYYDVAKRFYELPERMQNSILSANGEAGLFADYRKMGDKKFDIFAQVYGGQLGMGVVRDLRERFERERLPMYAPLVRGQGAHWLYYETTDGRSYKEAFANQAEREVAIKKAIDEGLARPDTIERITRPSEVREKGPPPVGFLGEVVSRLEATLPSTMPAAERKLIIDGVYDTFLNFLPSDMLRQELSTRQTFDVDGVRQFGVLGFDQDVLAVYERQMPKIAYQLGNLKFALPIENAMKKATEQAKLYEIAYREGNIPTRLQGRKLMSPKAVFDGMEDMRRRINFAYNPSYAWWVNGLATGNYIYSIAGNVSSALINTTVLAMMTFPSLVARYGVVKSSGMMLRAMKMFAQGGVDEQGNFTFGNAATGEVKTFFDYLTKRGVIGIAAEQELRQAQRAKISGYESALDKLNFVLGYVFKNSERFNREVTMLASFMLAREKGKSFKTAAEEAIRLNNNINGTVLPEAASRMYQTNLGRVILTFRTFALTQIINLSRAFGQALNAVDATPEDRKIARRQLLGIFGMTYMVAGVKGLPLFSAAEVLAAALMGDDDEPYDLQQEVADSIGLMGLNGPLNAAFDVDIASRTGFNGMLWRDDPKRLADIGFLLYSAERVLGPSYGLIQAQLRGVEKIAAGDIQRGFESMLPAPIRNPLKAARYATDGALTKDGLPIVDDISTWNSVMQVFGFAPAELAATQEQIGAKFAISDKLRSRRTALLTNLYTAMTAGDDQATQEAFEAIDKFNAANPMIGINPRSIQASFRERNRRAMESINGIYLPRNLLATTEEYMADLD